jgi:hypothetical protein
MRMLCGVSRFLAVTFLSSVVPLAALAVPAEVSALYDPLSVRGLSLVMEPLPDWSPGEAWTPPDGWEDWAPEQQAAFLENLAREAAWDVVRHDTTNSIVLPAWFASDGEGPVLVGVRRKSSRALPS